MGIPVELENMTRGEPQQDELVEIYMNHISVRRPLARWEMTCEDFLEFFLEDNFKIDLWCRSGSKSMSSINTAQTILIILFPATHITTNDIYWATQYECVSVIWYSERKLFDGNDNRRSKIGDPKTMHTVRSMQKNI